MNEAEQWEKVIRKLLYDTETKDVTWKREPRPDREDVVGFAYSTLVKDKRVLVYEYQYRHYVEEEVWDTQNDIAVELISDDGTLEWRLPGVSSRHELLDAIRQQTSGAQEFAAGYLNNW